MFHPRRCQPWRVHGHKPRLISPSRKLVRPAEGVSSAPLPTVTFAWTQAAINQPLAETGKTCRRCFIRALINRDAHVNTRLRMQNFHGNMSGLHPIPRERVFMPGF